MTAARDSAAPRRAFLSAYAAAFECARDACAPLGPLASVHAASLLDRFLFLNHVQSLGWLAGDPRYLARAFSPYENKPLGYGFQDRALDPLLRTLAGERGAGAELLIGDIAGAPRPRLPNRVYGALLHELADPFEYSATEYGPVKSGAAAIGPDMPGAAFENLLLGAARGAARTLRRSTGSYYTARIVARFMCRIALQEYLAAALAEKGGDMSAARQGVAAFLKIAETGQPPERTPRSLGSAARAQALFDALKQCRVCDPAAGAGAFLSGMLQLMLCAGALLHARIHGQPMPAPERAGLARHFIANCLYGVDIQPQAARLCGLRLWLALLCEHKPPLARGPAALPRIEHNIARGDSLLQEREILAPDGDGPEPFVWRENFARVFLEKGGFDILIGNPPYGFRGVLDAAARRVIRRDLGIAFASGDMAEPFITAMPRLAGGPRCVQVFLAPKKALYGESWSGVREFWRGARVLCLADAGKAFPGVLLEQAVFAQSHGKGAANGADRIAVASLEPGAQHITEHGAFPPRTVFHPEAGAARIYRGVAGERLARALEQGGHAPGRSPVRARIGLTGVTGFLADAPAPGDLRCVKGADIRRWGLNRERWIRAAALQRAAPGALARHTGPREKVLAQKIVAHIGRPRPHIRIAALVDRARAVAHDTAVIVWSEDPSVPAPVLCAWLNSAAVNWYAWHIVYNRAVRTMDLLEYYLRQIPFPARIPAGARRRLEDLAARAERGEPVHSDMDEIICGLYGLSARQTGALLADQALDA